MYVFALIGMQFFATKYRFNADGDPVEWQPHVYNHTIPPHAPWTPENPYTIRRSNFDDTLAAFTTVFQCLTEESWNFVMYDGVRSTGWGALLYFMAVMIIGNIIILNLFLAILLGNFSLEEQQAEMETAMIKGHQNLMDAIASGPIRKLSSVLPFDLEPSGVVGRGSVSASPQLALKPPRTDRTTPAKRSRIRTRASGRSSIISTSQRIPEDLIEEEDAQLLGVQSLPDNIDSAKSAPNAVQRTVSSKSTVIPEKNDHDGGDLGAANTTAAASGKKDVRVKKLSAASVVRADSVDRSDVVKNEVVVSDRNRSLFLFKKSSVVRQICHSISLSSYFEHLILAIIFVGSILLTVDNPLNDPSSQQSIILGITDNVFTCIFVVEMLLKVIDLGFLFNGRASYLRDPWNALDFAILACSAGKLFSSNKALRSLRSFRTLRALVSASTRRISLHFVFSV